MLTSYTSTVFNVVFVEYRKIRQMRIAIAVHDLELERLAAAAFSG
jgi:hypothetical protein